MSSTRYAAWAAVLLVLVVGLALAGGAAPATAPHSVDSDAADGTSALLRYARALGRPTDVLRSTFQPYNATGVLFVLSPGTAFTQSESGRLMDYLRAGGNVVYASESGDVLLDQALDIRRLPVPVPADLDAKTTALAGVRHVEGGATTDPLSVEPGQAVLLRASQGEPVAIEERIGRGRVVVLTDPLPLCNGYLAQADNGALARDLIAMGSAVAFDEYHHRELAAASASSPLTGWLSTAWGAALAWAALAVFVGLLLRGRAFGPRVALPGGGHRSTTEHVEAVGRLLQRARAGEEIRHRLLDAARLSVARRYGLVLGPEFERTLSVRASAVASELKAAEAVAAGRTGDAGLVELARLLHRLARAPGGKRSDR